jgi:manganese/zinc/iron transport system substrate-binding protein
MIWLIVMKQGWGLGGWATAVCVGLLMQGCGDSPRPAGGARSTPYTAVATTGMVGDLVRAVAGDKANVMGLMGEGVDPHLYKPTRDDVNKLLGADIVFYSGLLLEGRMTDTFAKIARKGIPVHPVTETLPESALIEPHGAAGHPDPHVWMDVSQWSQAVDGVAGALAEFDPANAEFYRANAAAYRAKLAGLHEYGKKSIGSIPEAQRVLVTAHDAFNYFGRVYGIRVMAVQGISTESEAGVQDINRLVNFIVENRIPAIFVETSVSDKNLRAIVEGARARGWDVRIGGSLFSDAMGKPGTYEGTYPGMLDHNITTISKALGGSAPATGFEGRLAK